MFDIIFTRESLKFLKKLSTEDKTRIISCIERCRIKPHSRVKKLVASPYFRLRAGQYRIILDIQAGKLLIIVVEIGNRRNVCR